MRVWEYESVGDEGVGDEGGGFWRCSGMRRRYFACSTSQCDRFRSLYHAAQNAKSETARFAHAVFPANFTSFRP